MRNRLLEALRPEDLSGNARDLAELIGMEAFIALVDVYGGTNGLYIPKAEQLVLPVRDEMIRREFDGGNSATLARKYGLTERHIRDIVKEKMKELRIAPGPGQLSLWD